MVYDVGMRYNAFNPPPHVNIIKASHTPSVSPTYHCAPSEWGSVVNARAEIGVTRGAQSIATAAEYATCGDPGCPMNSWNW